MDAVGSPTPAGSGAGEPLRAGPRAPTATQPADRLGAGAGMLAVVAVGVAQVVTDLTFTQAPPAARAVWWAAFAVYAAAFALDAELVPLRRQPPERVLVVVLVVAASVAWVANPSADWTPVLFVVTAAAATALLTPAGVVGLVTLQSLVTAVGAALDGRGTIGVPFTVAIYASFQAFAAIVVRTAMREAQAREEADAAHAALAAVHADLAAAHADLRATTVLLGASSRDAERLRIARDLHDVIGHQLTALALELEIASHRVEGEAAEHVARARAVAKDLLRDVRAVVGELRGGAGDLEPTLREVLDLPGLTVALSVDPALRLDDARLVAVVRCVQEAATNALRHAPGATRLAVRVRREGDDVEVDVHDDGPGAVAWEPGHGLRGMQERVAALGGTLAVDPGPGRGFRVTARVPA
ncbi:histidine kinase [Cellulomonas sp.]|uniref:sensor histidine kinase n=1 Tax=Cellulomonas sp. TaxID=40001 RepID=UPI0028114FEB|nr:histidine kinase [Cellulomonas sp.]